MRDVWIGYIFISVTVLILWVSILIRKKHLQHKLTELKAELGER